MERLDLYTVERVNTNESIIRGTKIPKGFYRLVIHVCIFNSNGEMLIQQRQPFKSGWSNMWDLTVGGSAATGETSRIAAEREVLEEIGYEVSLEGVIPALTVNFDEGFNDIYLIKSDLNIEELNLQYEEVQAVKWAGKDEILKMIEDETFIPYHKSLIDLLFIMKDKKGAF